MKVADAQALINTGAADGRFMAVGGYWYSLFLPCRFQAHRVPLADQCGYGLLSDAQQTSPDHSFGSGLGLSPAILTESAAAFGVAPNGSKVVAIVHVADDRMWQCGAKSPGWCRTRPVLDRMIWVDGQEIDPAQFLPGLVTTTSYDEAIAAATESGAGPAVLAYPTDAARLQEIDPRFAGSASGLVWYVRVISGTAFSNGVAPGIDVLIDDDTGELLSTLTQDINLDDTPARVVLDSKGWARTGELRPRYVLVSGSLGDRGDWPTANFTEGWLDSSSTPLVLAGGTSDPAWYTVHAYIGTETQGMPDGPSCDLALDLMAGDDVAYYANFPRSGDCVWKQGERPFD